MTALAQGTTAPCFTLNSLDGSIFELKKELRGSPLVLAAFFKVSCPVCQLEFPYLERLHRSYPSIPIWGISQDDADATASFSRMFGLSFPMLLDAGLKATVEYGLTNVPSLFLIGEDQKIKQSIVGFDKAQLELLNESLSQSAKQSLIPLFTAADEVPELKPG